MEQKIIEVKQSLSFDQGMSEEMLKLFPNGIKRILFVPFFIFKNLNLLYFYIFHKIHSLYMNLTRYHYNNIINYS